MKMNEPHIRASLKLWRKRRHSLQQKVNTAHANHNKKWEGIYRARLKHAVEIEHRREKQLKALHANQKHVFQAWMPGAIRHPLEDAGTFVSGYTPKGILHTTESHGDATSTLAQKRSAPHFEITWEGTIIQYIALDRAGRALEHNGWAETNRGNTFQIEICNFAAHGGQIDDNHPQAVALRKVMRFIEENGGVERAAHYKFSENGQGVRLDQNEWVHAKGWLGHMHVPLNNHWDPGGIEIHKFL